MRRVVTGIDKDGKSVVVSDGEPPVSFKGETGRQTWEVWRTYGLETIPVDFTDPTVGMTSCIPEPGEGGSVLRIVRISGTQELEQAIKNGVDHAAAIERYEAYNSRVDPKTGKSFFEAQRVKENPGMHSTDTIDYCIVLSGETWMELDDGKEVHLKQGDVVVQNGTKHAWRLKSPDTCVMAFCMLGVANKYRGHFQDK